LYKNRNIPPIYTNFEGINHPIGKIFIFIHKLSYNRRKYSEKVWIRIRTDAMKNFTMPTTCIEMLKLIKVFNVILVLYRPISNAF
jgi:hypothetical protein